MTLAVLATYSETECQACDLHSLLHRETEEAQLLSAKSQQMVVEKAQGKPVASIADRHGVCEQRVYAIRKQAREFVTACYMDLLVARKTNEVCALVIPYGDDYLVAMRFADWLVAELRGLGLDLKVGQRRASNGLLLTMEDIGPLGAGEVDPQ